MLDLITARELAEREEVTASTIRRWVKLGWLKAALGPPYVFERDVEVIIPDKHTYCMECANEFCQSGRGKERKFCTTDHKNLFHYRKGRMRRRLREMQTKVIDSLDWDTVAQACKATGKPFLLGRTTDFSKQEKIVMDKAARERNLCISMGNNHRDPTERDDELYIQAKL